MIYHFNYADEKFKKQQNYNTISIRKYIPGIKTLSYTYDDIDSEFIDKNKCILSQKRGGGYWIWKPYFIKKVFSLMDYDDILIYTDSGSFLLNNIDALLKELSNKDAVFFKLPLIEGQWTNEHVLRFFKENFTEIDFNSNQIMANFFIIKKSNTTIKFVDDFFRLSQDPLLITDLATKTESENTFFIEHRHDQSILSCLVKHYKFNLFSDISDYGLFPLRYMRLGRIINITSQSIQKPVILFNKRENPINYKMKFYVKCFLNKIKLVNVNLVSLRK